MIYKSIQISVHDIYEFFHILKYPHTLHLLLFQLSSTKLQLNCNGTFIPTFTRINGIKEDIFDGIK